MEEHSDSALSITARFQRTSITSERGLGSLAFGGRLDSCVLSPASLGILDLIQPGILVSDGTGCIVYMNAQAQEIIGRPVKQLVGRPIIDVFIDSDYDLIGNAPSASASVHDGHFTVQLETRHAGKRSVKIRIVPLPDHIAGYGGEMYEIYDVSEDLRHTRQLLHDATHDSLTGLANRRALTERLAQCACWEPEPGSESVLALLDLDGFKQINDTCGHLAGDDVLQAVARVLQANTRKADMTARLGGDEFVVLLIDCGIEESQRILNSIRESIGAYRYISDDNEFNITASIGATCIDACNTESAELLRRADKACYRAKYSGGDRVVVDSGRKP